MNYKEKLEEAKRLYKSANDDQKYVLESLFPELKESEDEKIRELLINLANQTWDGGDCFKDFSKEKILAWLEKRSEPTDINPSEFDLRLNKLLKQFETLPKEELASSLSFYLNVVQNDGTYKAEEKQGVQKPANKVESKFHEGDWVVQENIGVYKVIEVCESWYEVVDNKDKHYSIGFDKEYMCHLYTIQDAKDGDVLQLGVVTAIFQKYIGNGNCKCYCSVCDGIFEIPSQDDDDYYGCHDAIPATKEQRELLFKSMKDDGYEWDAEKLELKEIELTKSESEEELSDFEAALFSAFSDGWQQYLHGEEVDFAQWAKEHSAELLEAANQNHVAWSEEDEAMWAEISDLLWEGYKQSSSKFSWDDIRNWLNPKLKSLRPQSTWKPTKDQMEALHDLNLTGNISYAGQGQVLIELYNDLKKL